MLMFLVAAAASISVPFVGVRLWDLGAYPTCASQPPPGNICVNLENDGSFLVDLRAGRPDWIKTNTLVLVVGGKPVAASISTIGFEGQSQALEDLEIRYGRPASLTTVVIQNGFGAHFRIIHARWRLKDGSVVEFDGAKEHLDEGEVRWLH